jgi:hypothetical protein
MFADFSTSQGLRTLLTISYDKGTSASLAPIQVSPLREVAARDFL